MRACQQPLLVEGSTPGSFAWVEQVVRIGAGAVLTLTLEDGEFDRLPDADILERIERATGRCFPRRVAEPRTRNLRLAAPYGPRSGDAAGPVIARSLARWAWPNTDRRRAGRRTHWFR